MKFALWKKCLLAFGICLFLSVLLPPVFGSTAVASATTTDEEQNSIKLNVKSKSLVKDSTFNLKLYNITESQKVSYKSGDTSIATVDDSGLITAVDFGTASITAILKPNNTVEEAKFWSNDSNIASVSIGGRISAKSAGVTYIFASIGNGKYDYCKVTVVEKSDTTPTPSGTAQ